MKTLEGQSLSQYSRLKIGGVAKKVYIPESSDDFKKLLLDNPHIPIIAGGSNILISDRTFDEVCLLKHTFFEPELLSQDTLLLSAPQKITALLRFMENRNISGLEFLSGVPGITIGGAIYQNFSAFGIQISDIVKEVTFLEDGKELTLTGEQCDFSYRTSLFKKQKLPVISASFNVTVAKTNEIKGKIEHILSYRLKNNPLSLPNIGCIFKNPPEEPAGLLIDKAGLKGLTIGGAQIWNGHANFIVNTGQATYKDVKDLIEKVQNEVRKQHNIVLEPEITIMK